MKILIKKVANMRFRGLHILKKRYGYVIHVPFDAEVELKLGD